MEFYPGWWRDRLQKAWKRHDKHINLFAININLPKAESERIRREECIFCSFPEECEQFQTNCGRYHLCLSRSEGYWSPRLRRKIWFRRVWMYIPSSDRVDTMEFYEAVIFEVLQDEDGISIRELSRRADIPVSTCWKLINKLVESGHINKTEIKLKGKPTHLLYLPK